MPIPGPKCPEPSPLSQQFFEFTTICTRTITVTVLIFYQIHGEVGAFDFGNSFPMPAIAENGVFVQQILIFTGWYSSQCLGLFDNFND